MPTFAYVARTREGQTQRGTLNAENQQAAVRALQGRGLVPDRVEERGAVRAARRAPRVKTREVLVFTRQLATTVNAGLPLLQGLDILAEQAEDKRFGEVLAAIGEDVEGGESFSEALRKYSRIFPDLYVSMVRAGEAGGNLAEVLVRLAEYIEAMEEIKRRIRSAMAYPVTALVICLAIAFGLVTWLVPKFADLFTELAGGKPLPLPTRVVMGASDFLTSVRVLWIIGAIVVVVMGIRMYGRTTAGRYNLDRIKLQLPLFGKLFRKVAIARFARTLSTLTRSGVPILSALEIGERTAGNEVFVRVIHTAGECVKNGEPLAEPLARSAEFPAIVTRMISIGERTGALDDMLGRISDFYDSEVRATIDAMTSLIEPLMIVVIGVIVGSIVISLYMPMFRLIAEMGTGAG